MKSDFTYFLPVTYFNLNNVRNVNREKNMCCLSQPAASVTQMPPKEQCSSQNLDLKLNNK